MTYKNYILLSLFYQEFSLGALTGKGGFLGLKHYFHNTAEAFADVNCSTFKRPSIFRLGLLDFLDTFR